MHTLVISRHGCVGILISWSSSFAVGIQKERRPSSTKERAAKSRMSSSMAKNEYGFLGGMYASCLEFC